MAPPIDCGQSTDRSVGPPRPDVVRHQRTVKEIVNEPELLGVEQGATLARIRHRQMVALFILRPCGSLRSALTSRFREIAACGRLRKEKRAKPLRGAMTRRRNNDASLGRGIPPRRDARLEAVA